MPWLVAKLVLAGFLLPAAVVFAISYKHAMRHWLRPVSPIPTASIASHRGRIDRGHVARRFQAAAIAAAFASVSIMILVAVLVVGIVLVSTMSQ